MQEYKRKQASQAETPQTRLEELGRDDDPEVRRLVTLNPNTPLEDLLSLAQEFPDELLKNPIMDFLNLTQPDFYKDCTPETWLSLLRRPGVPRAWVQWLADFHKDEALVEAALLHEQLAETEAKRLPENLHDIDCDNLANALQQEGTPVEWLAEFVTHPSLEIRLAAARHPGTPKALLLKLATDADERVRGAIAEHANLPVEAALQLASDANREVRRAIAVSPDLPVEVLKRLVVDAESQVRVKVAYNPALPEELLIQLAADPHSPVRYVVAAHPALPEQIVLQLASDPDMVVRCTIAERQVLPEELLPQLAADPDGRVRDTIVRRQALPEELLLQLAADPEQSVHDHAKKRLAKEPRKPLKLLARDADPKVRASILWRSDLSSALLTSLTSDPVQYIKQVAQRRLSLHLYAGSTRYQSTSPGENNTADDENWSEYQAMLLIEHWFNPNPYDPREFYYDEFGYFAPLVTSIAPELRLKIHTHFLQRWTAQEEDWSDRVDSPEGSSGLNWVSFFARLQLSGHWQRFFAVSPLWWERYLVALKPETSRPVLEQLADDGNHCVRAVAHYYLNKQA